jgi:hypothetical protein
MMSLRSRFITGLGWEEGKARPAAPDTIKADFITIRSAGEFHCACEEWGGGGRVEQV